MLGAIALGGSAPEITAHGTIMFEVVSYLLELYTRRFLYTVGRVTPARVQRANTNVLGVMRFSSRTHDMIVWHSGTVPLLLFSAFAARFAGAPRVAVRMIAMHSIVKGGQQGLGIAKDVFW